MNVCLQVFKHMSPVCLLPVLVLPLVLSLSRLGLLIFLLSGLFGDELPASKASLLQSEFSYLMEILVQIGHMLESLALIIGVAIAFNQLRIEYCRIIRDELKKTPTAATVATIIFVILLTVVSTITAPVYRNVWINETVHSYNDSPKIARAYAVMAIFTHISQMLQYHLQWSLQQP